MVRFVLPFILLLAGMYPASAQMAFDAKPPRHSVALWGNAWDIYAKGIIDQGTAARLEALILRLNLPDKSQVHFDSEGGNLLAALELGRVIRKYGLHTYVGDWKRKDLVPCFSACTLAYLGGRFRFYSDNAMYGMHRFYFTGGASAATTSDVAQVASAEVVAYMREMGVDPNLFTEMTMAGRHELNILPKERLEELHAVNNGVGPSVWTLEGVENGIYLKGVRDSVYGASKFIVMCDSNSKQIAIFAGFDPVGRTEEILKMGAQSLLVDGKSIPLKTEKPVVNDGWINVLYELDDHHVAALVGAETVGVAFQFFPEAPLFLGFDRMHFLDARPKLSGLMSVCGVK